VKDKDSNFLIHSNLITPFETYNYIMSADPHVPTAYTGVVFPYVEELSDIDYSIVGRVFTRYFAGQFGTDRHSAMQALDSIKTGWGVICKTVWGSEIAHLLRVIEICFEVQGHVRCYVNPTGQYSGAVIFGGLFTLKIGDKVIEPYGRDQIVAGINNSTPHVAALDFIFAQMYFGTHDERTASKQTVRTVRDVAFLIRSKGVVEAQRSEIVKRAYHLKFKSEPGYLTPTAFNISRVLNAINDLSFPESEFSLHPEALFAASRAERLLSAFGIECPSFVVPGGKKMSLEDSFKVKDRGADGNVTQREVHKISVALVSFKKAVDDFELVKKEKVVFNPFGNQLGSRSSTDKMTKSFEKDSADQIITALRSAVGAVQKAESAGKRKDREGEDGDDEERAKRNKFFDV
jgi:hypothetical protein